MSYPAISGLGGRGGAEQGQAEACARVMRGWAVRYGRGAADAVLEQEGAVVLAS
jgi:hypothetical protein